jgi:uncharacterized protein YndB with AHSA1/START domain
MSRRDGTYELREGGTKILRFERRLAHPAAKVWAAITDPDQIEAWWARAQVDLREGGDVVVAWLNSDDQGNQVTMHAKVRDLEPERVFEITGDVHGRVRFELEPDGEGATVLRFINETPAPDEYLSRVLAGWHWHLDALERFLVGGERVDWPNWPRPEWESIHERYQREVAAS